MGHTRGGVVVVVVWALLTQCHTAISLYTTLACKIEPGTNGCKVKVCNIVIKIIIMVPYKIPNWYERNIIVTKKTN